MVDETLERVAEAGYRTVAERFSIDAQVRRIEAVYDEELARAGVKARARPPKPVRVGNAVGDILTGRIPF